MTYVYAFFRSINEEHTYTAGHEIKRLATKKMTDIFELTFKRLSKRNVYS